MGSNVACSGRSGAWVLATDATSSDIAEVPSDHGEFVGDGRRSEQAVDGWRRVGNAQHRPLARRRIGADLRLSSATTSTDSHISVSLLASNHVATPSFARRPLRSSEMTVVSIK